jgi:hypothetical protein
MPSKKYRLAFLTRMHLIDSAGAKLGPGICSTRDYGMKASVCERLSVLQFSNRKSHRHGNRCICPPEMVFW